jgi:predicted DNA-binding transcriptional regulator YafY
MNEVVGILKHLNGFSHFGEMSEMIAKLENNLNRNRSEGRNIIQFESNALLKGLNWIDPLYKAIANNRVLLIDYRSFRAREAKQGIYSPYLLKEYRNRWFVIVKSKNHQHLLTLALDRIESVHELPREPFVPHPSIDFDHYYDNVVGVTKNERSRTTKVILALNAQTTPYILTKPIHHTQTVLHESEDRTVIQIEVIPNFELEREILGYGAGIKVLGPRLLVKRVFAAIREANGLYSEQ